MHRGYIRLWRKIDDNPIALKPAYLSVWLYILRKANFQDKEIIWNNKKTLVKRGSFITSSNSISSGTGVPRGTVQRILEYLKNEPMIELVATKKFTLITVLNYDDYQNSEPVNEQQVGNKWVTSEQQVGTTNNNKEELKKTNKNSRFTPPSLEEVKQYCIERNNNINPQSFISWYESNGWKVGRNKMKDWKASVRNWETREKSNKPKILKLS